jgi:hypothetical protein
MLSVHSLTSNVFLVSLLNPAPLVGMLLDIRQAATLNNPMALEFTAMATQVKL